MFSFFKPKWKDKHVKTAKEWLNSKELKEINSIKYCDNEVLAIPSFAPEVRKKVHSVRYQMVDGSIGYVFTEPVVHGFIGAMANSGNLIDIKRAYAGYVSIVMAQYSGLVSRDTGGEMEIQVINQLLAKCKVDTVKISDFTKTPWMKIVSGTGLKTVNDRKVECKWATNMNSIMVVTQADSCYNLPIECVLFGVISQKLEFG